MTAAVMEMMSNLALAWGAALLSVAAIGASAYGFGRWVFARVAVESDSPPSDRRLVILGVGAGMLSLLVFASGLAGLLYRPVLIGLLLAGAAGWILRTEPPRQTGEPTAPRGDSHGGESRHPEESTSEYLEHEGETPGSGGIGGRGLDSAQAPTSNAATRVPTIDRPFLRRIAAGGRLFALVLIMFGVLMPEFFHDALIYHLELPRYDLLHHRIRFLPWNYNSALPANVESLYLIALAFSDERATKLLHAAFALLCVATLGALGRCLAPRPESSRLTGLFAGTLFLLTPSVVLLAGVSGNDMGLLFFELTSFLAWWRWRTVAARPQHTAMRAPDRAWLTCSGLLMGFALGSKYSALFFLTGIAAAWCVWPEPQGMPRVARLCGFGRWLITAAATASPWWVRNLLDTGDPFYPSLGPSTGPLFATGPSRPYLDENGIDWLHHDLGTGGVTWTILPDYLLRLASNDIGWLTLIAASATAMVIMARRRRAALRPLLALIAASTAIWWIVSPVPRYLMPMGALLALLGAIGLAELSASGRAARAAAGVALTIGLVAQSIQAAGLIRDNYIAPFTALTGLRALEPGRAAASTGEMAVSLLKLIPDGEARRQWLDWSVPPYAAIDMANRLLPRGAVVLFVGEYRGFYLDRDRIISTKYDTSPLIRWAEESADAPALAARLRREGVTSLLYNQVEARRLEEEGYPALLWPDRDARERFEQLRREELTLLTVRNGVFLYAVGRAAPPADH
jgi:hypothetical protein